MEWIANNKKDITNVQMSTIKERMSKGRLLYKAAWGFEIIAAITGVIVAIVIGHDAYTNYLVENPLDPKGEMIISTAHWADVVLGSMPVGMVALAEILKIPIVYLVYINKNLFTKVFFSIVLLGLTLITFETVISGFERQFTNVIYKVERPKEQLRQINSEIAILQEGISVVNKITSRSVNKDKKSELALAKDIYSKAVSDLEDKISNLLKDSNVESNYEKDQLSVDIARYEAERLSAMQEAKENYESFMVNREANSAKSQEINDKLIGQIDKDIEGIQKNIFEWDESAKGSWTKEYCSKDLQCKENYEELKNLKEEKKRLRSKQSGDTGVNYFANYQVLKKSIESNYDEKIKFARDRVREIENTQNKELANRQDVQDLKEKREGLDASYEDDKKKINISFAKQGEQIGSHKETNEKNKIDLKVKLDKREEIKNDINKYISVAQIYRFTKYRLNFMADGDVCIKFSDSMPNIENEFSFFSLFREDQKRECLEVKKAKEVTIDEVTSVEVTKTAFWWYGSLSALVAIMGVVLAFGAFILTHPNEKYLDTKKRHRLKNTIRYMFISLRKRIREPKIITKTRIKEVPKEVIKEVLVDKVVFTEVPVEVIRKEVFYEPLYTNDPDLLKFGTAKVKDILNRFGKDKIAKKDTQDG
jgi:hypothetical protein